MTPLTHDVYVYIYYIGYVYGYGHVSYAKPLVAMVFA
jgi:hypothetical protein